MMNTTGGNNTFYTHLTSQEVDDLKGVLDDTDGHQLLAVVATVHHEGVSKALHDGALGLAEPLGRIPTSRVGKILGIVLLDCNVVL